MLRTTYLGKLLLAATLVTAPLAAPTAANAATTFSTDFDSFTAGPTLINWNPTGTGFGLASPYSGNPGGGAPSVDLVRSGEYGITCAGGSGYCVDLDGSTNQAARMAYINLAAADFLFGVNAGDTVTLSFDVSGNQRGGTDSFVFGFVFNGLYSIPQANFTTVGFSIVNPNDPIVAADFAFYSGLGSSAPWTHYSVSFVAPTAGRLLSFVGADGGDNVGPLVDNYAFSITSAAVPEPASWAMMIVGFGAIGASLRSARRKQAGRIVVA